MTAEGQAWFQELGSSPEATRKSAKQIFSAKKKNQKDYIMKARRAAGRQKIPMVEWGEKPGWGGVKYSLTAGGEQH